MWGSFQTKLANELDAPRNQQRYVKAKEEGKADGVIPRIVEGTIKKFKDEFVLMNQAYIRDEAITVQELMNQKIAALGENIIVRRFQRWALGETTAESSAEE